MTPREIRTRRHPACRSKVVRIALQGAALAVGLLITTEALIVERPEPKSPAAPPGAGGGCDF